MGFSRGPIPFAAGLGLRAILIGGLCFLAMWLVLDRGYYASALVVAGVAVLLVADIVRQVAAADRLLSRFIDGLTVEGDERPTARAAGMPQLDAAIARALDRVGQARSERQRRIDYLETLADTVSAALLVINEDGKVEAANQAARKLLPSLTRLSDLGEDAARRIEAARLGSGQVVRLRDGRAMFALVTGFAAREGGRKRLVSLQRVAGDLDAVELRAWSDLVRVLSHEIMNSLTPICSLAESSRALLNDPQGEAAEALEVIGRRSAGLMTFVERYREVFDVPAPDRRALTLGEIVSRTGALMTSQMADAGVAYEARSENPNVTLQADPALMDQALINLLKNALEAVRGRQGAAVTLAVRLSEETALIEVEDNGPGLSPEDVETAFVPFFTRKAGGSGVGLSVARQIVLAHGGAIEYLPAASGGALFRVSLPLT
jgi:nitrogen fixation/metabolism regulation signal transduction histidine kinase